AAADVSGGKRAMTALFQSSAGAAAICRGVTQMGLSLLIQSTLLLVVGLAVGRRLASRGPSLQALVYRTTLVAVVLTGLLSVLLAGALRPFWSLTLPPTDLPAAELAASHIVPPAAVLALPERPVVSPAPTPTREVRSHQRFGPVSPIDQHRVGGAARFYLGAIVLWGGGSALLLSWLLFSHLWVGRLRR